MLSIVSPFTLPFQKVWIYHVAIVIICSTNDVHCNVCHSKSKVHKLGFLNGVPILLIIEGKWLEAIVHMIKFEFLNLVHSKQVELLISVCVYGKFQISFTSALLGFQEDIQQFIQEGEKKLSVEGLIVLLAISFIDDVQCNVKHKLHFDELK